MAASMTPQASESSVLDALRAVRDPDLRQDIVALGFIKNLRICDGNAAFSIELTTPACPVKDLMKAEAEPPRRSPRRSGERADVQPVTIAPELAAAAAAAALAAS
jgi:metal-sulfur cluster biosynthetic enzyme